MKLRALLSVLLLLLTLTAAGCSRTPATPDAAAKVVRQFLQARSKGDAGAIFPLLTPAVQKALPRTEVAKFVRQEGFGYGAVGTPVEMEPGWVRVPVADVRLDRPDGETRWPEVQLTLHYDGSRWGVAWVEPLAAQAREAYLNSRYGDELTLADTIHAADPYHYRGPLEYHYAYRGLKRLREAELALAQAGQLATPSQAPEVEDAWARFKRSLGHPEDAIPHAQAALQKAAPYSPFLYSNRWQADLLVVLGRSYLAQGNLPAVTEAVKQAAGLDPENAALAMFQFQMAHPGQPSPPPAPGR
jgi:hypothetical protein